MNRVCRRFVAGGILLLGLAHAGAQSFSWNTDANNQNWNNTANWTPTGFPNAAGSEAVFGNVITGNRNVRISGTTITVGTIRFNTSTATRNYSINQQSGGSLIFNNNGLGALIDMDALNVGNHTITAPITLQDSLTISNRGSGTFTISGNISMGANNIVAAGGGATTLSGILSGTGGLTYGGSAILTLSGLNTYSGATLVQSGTVRAGVANAFSANSAFSVNSGGTLDLNNFNQTIASISGSGNLSLGSGTLTVGDSSSTAFSGLITGTGSLVKQGSGTLELSGTANHGSSTVNAGRLVISGSHLGGITVNAGGTLEGTAPILGGVTLNAGGALSAGNNGVGSLDVGGNSLLNGGLGSVIRFDISSATGTAGTDWDLLNFAEPDAGGGVRQPDHRRSCGQSVGFRQLQWLQLGVRLSQRHA